jgi:hypothetical protein
MELDLQSLFGLHVHRSTQWLRPRNLPPPPPAFGLVCEGDIGQPKKTTSLCDPLPKTIQTTEEGVTQFRHHSCFNS